MMRRSWRGKSTAPTCADYLIPRGGHELPRARGGQSVTLRAETWVLTRDLDTGRVVRMERADTALTDPETFDPLQDAEFRA